MGILLPSGGYIDIDVNQSAGEIYFYYDGVRVPNADVEIIAADFGINTYRVLIQDPNKPKRRVAPPCLWRETWLWFV